MRETGVGVRRIAEHFKLLIFTHRIIALISGKRALNY